MFKKIIFKILFLIILFSNNLLKANDVSSMAGISEAAGSSAQAAADQLAADAGKVTENIKGATDALGEAKSDIGKALDTCPRKFSQRRYNFSSSSYVNG